MTATLPFTERATERPLRLRVQKGPRHCTSAAGNVNGRDVVHTITTTTASYQDRLAEAAAAFYRRFGLLPSNITDAYGTVRVAGPCEHCGRVMFGRPRPGLACVKCQPAAAEMAGRCDGNLLI